MMNILLRHSPVFRFPQVFLSFLRGLFFLTKTNGEVIPDKIGPEKRNGRKDREGNNQSNQVDGERFLNTKANTFTI